MSHLKIIEDLEDDLLMIKSWLSKQFHLPQNIDEASSVSRNVGHFVETIKKLAASISSHDQLIRRFLLCSNRSLEKTKNLIDLCYTIRSQAPEIFANRSIFSAELQRLIKLGDVLPLPKTTSKNYKLILFRINNKNADNFVFHDVIKISLMVGDVRLKSELDIADGEIPIFDMNNMTLQHLAKVNLSVIRKYMLYTQEAHPVRLKGIHIINTPSFLDKVMLLIKPFMKSEVAAMLHFHTNVESLAKYVDLDLMPNDYGGKAGSLVDLKKHWVQKVEDHNDYFLDDSRWKIDESKRPPNNKNGKALFGLQGSFKSLSID